MSTMAQPARGKRKPAATPPRAATRLVQHIVAAWRTQALHAAVKLGLPEQLAGGPQPPAALAAALGCDGDGLQRLLRALCTLAVCTERRDGRFALTSTGRLLCSDGGGQGTSLRALALWWGGPLWPMWGELDYSVRTGHSARQKLTGAENYGYLEKSAETAQVFHEAMRSMTALILDDVAQLPCWRGATTLVDVGGGHGQLALAILAAQPQLQATVFDLPSAAAGARAQVAAGGLSERCRFVAGSFFESVPAGADCYLLKSILHNWNDERCAAILATCRAAAPPHARLLLVERVRPERLRAGLRDEGLARTDLNMLAGLGGRERSLQEFSTLLKAAGFAVQGVHPTSFEFSVIEASVLPTPAPRRQASVKGKKNTKG
jgi:O-methyltransferase domain/Dimerisation domain